MGDLIPERGDFSDAIMEMARHPIEREVHSLPKYLNGLRNHNFVPVSAPLAFGCAIDSALKTLDDGGGGPLGDDVSPGVLKMVRGLGTALGMDERLVAPDRRSRVIFARVDCHEESTELVDALLECMREYGLSRGRGRGYAIEGCMFRDSPLLALVKPARDEIMEMIGAGGPLTGDCCSDCAQRYREKPENIRVVGFDIADCYGYVGVGFKDCQDAVSRANRGLLEIRGVGTEHGEEALRAALEGRPMRVRGKNLLPDVLVVCPLDWDEPVPSWTLPHAVIVESERVSDADEIMEAFGRRISSALGMWDCHMAPHVPRAASRFAGGSSGAYRTTGQTLRMIEAEPAAMGKCLSHVGAFRMFLWETGADFDDVKTVSDDLTSRMVKDVLKADASSEDSGFEREACIRLLREYLMPLAFSREGGKIGQGEGASECASLEMFEAQLVEAGLIDKGDDNVEGFRASMYELYEKECMALVYEGASFSVEEVDPSGVVDVGTLRYDRNPHVGQYLEGLMLSDIREFRKSARGNPNIVRNRIVSSLCRHYGYCARCAGQTFDMVVSGRDFYKKPLFALGGRGFEVIVDES